MTAEIALFWVFAICTVLSAAGVIAARNPINSAMALVASFFFLAGLYVLLWAHTIAVLQVLVYAGAIMVLFLFVIMLLNLTDEDSHRAGPTLASVMGGLATAALLFVLDMALVRISDPPAALNSEQASTFGSIKALGALLYTHYLLPFEAVSLLLLVAMVGAVVVAKPRI
jgi:NADH-quinone oxidoreductase subunit J